MELIYEGKRKIEYSTIQYSGERSASYSEAIINNTIRYSTVPYCTVSCHTYVPHPSSQWQRVSPAWPSTEMKRRQQKIKIEQRKIKEEQSVRTKDCLEKKVYVKD